MLWTALFTTPLMIAIQELCARIALTTGVGLGVSLRRKFPTSLVGIAILALIAANTINVGADLGAVAAGGSLLSRRHVPALWLVAPAAALILGMELFGTYPLIFGTFKWLTVALFAYVLTAFFAHPNLIELLGASLIPRIQLSPDYLMGLVAVLGTTISPYLFFWQACSEVDEMTAAGLTTEAARRGATTREIRDARVDVFTGMFFSQAVMYFIILTSAVVLNAHGTTNIQSADQAASALAPLAGQFAFILFAAGLIGSGLLAIPILTGSAAYAVKEFAGLPGGLAEKPRFRPTFYAVIVVATLVGVAINFLQINPIRALVITAVINGMIAPPLMTLIVLLGSDREVMGRRASGRVSQVLTWGATAAMGLAASGLAVSLWLSR
jgi:Mn2+/Fe2+ NRAMP family transporter